VRNSHVPMARPVFSVLAGVVAIALIVAIPVVYTYFAATAGDPAQIFTAAVLSACVLGMVLNLGYLTGRGRPLFW
jgi:hypothetical protein